MSRPTPYSLAAAKKPYHFFLQLLIPVFENRAYFLRTQFTKPRTQSAKCLIYPAKIKHCIQTTLTLSKMAPKALSFMLPAISQWLCSIESVSIFGELCHNDSSRLFVENSAERDCSSLQNMCRNKNILWTFLSCPEPFNFFTQQISATYAQHKQYALQLCTNNMLSIEYRKNFEGKIYKFFFFSFLFIIIFSTKNNIQDRKILRLHFSA